MPEGDLDQFITDQERRLSWKLRTYLALDVARGMQYLHSVGIFHRDLSARVSSFFLVVVTAIIGRYILPSQKKCKSNTESMCD